MKLDRKDILTIPNLLSLIRLLMIPLIVWLYLNDLNEWTAAMLLLSGITDVVDGFIARRFNQISDFGKVFDPVADKLTQAAMLLCLTSRHPSLLWPFLLMIVKEGVTAVLGIVAICRTGEVKGAEWHGKAATMLLYGMMILHVLWEDIPLWVSNTFMLSCIAMMVVSLLMYASRNMRSICRADRK